MKIPTYVLAPVGLIGGFAVAAATENRALGGVVLFVIALVCAYVWWRRRGLLIAVALVGVYLLGFGLSHPLSKMIGAWPSVLVVAVVVGGVSWWWGDRGGKAVE